MAPALPLAVALLWWAPQPARACSCAPFDGPEGLLAPREETVAPNARFWFTSLDGSGAVLLDAEGGPIETHESELEVRFWGQEATVGVLTPVEPLPVGERVRLRLWAQDVTETFTVAGPVDEPAPAVPELIDVERFTRDGEGGGDCGDIRQLSLHYASDAIVLVRFGDDDTSLESDPPSGRVGDLNVDLGDGASFSWGGACTPWPGGSERITVEVGAIDAAGNFSGWSEPQAFRRPQLDGFLGCSAGAAPGGGPGASPMTLLLAALLGWRRRRAGKG